MSAGIKSVQMTRDGHFQLAADVPADAPVVDAADVPADVPAPRRIKALLPLEPHEVDERITDERVLSVKKGGWFNSRQHKPTPAAASFVNRTDNWMALSHMANGEHLSTHVQIATPQPTVPPQRYQKKPPAWPVTAWHEYQKVYQQLKPLREGPGHHAATVAAVFLGPDSCVLKIMYVFFTKTGEDDYPYVPRGCGDMFDFALNANSMPVPWMLIVGTVLIVTGTHSSADTIQ